MAAPLLSLAGITLTFGGDPLFDGADLMVRPRQRIALVGRNGSGKSTLLKIAAGLVEADGGERFIDPGVSVGYLTQEPDLSGYASVGAFVAAGAPPMGDPGAPARLLAALQLDADAEPSSLSGGEARRAALARLIVGDHDALLLDEPTNHLDIGAVGWLEDFVRTSRAAFVVISHDRAFLEATTNETVWIDRGRTRALGRGFSEFEAWRDRLLEEEEAARHKLDRKIVAEEHWVRYGVTARRKRNVRRMADLAALRASRREARRIVGEVAFAASEGATSGKRVIVAERISKAFGARTIVDGFSIEIARGDRVGFVGPNGAGKTTLLKMLTGALAPDTGAVTLGANIELLTLDQRRAGLDETMRVGDAITDGRGDWVTIGGRKKHAASYLEDFLFTREQWRAPVSSLSGGERARLALAAALAKPSNLLVLDEPTNDLDLETLELLEEMLADYPGTLLLVSHDRRFLDRLATSVVTPAPDGRPGRWIEYVGGYEDMLVQRGAPPGSLAPPQQSTKPPAKSGAPSPARSEAPKPASTKLTYKEKSSLERLPGEMSVLEAAIAAAKARLADPSLFARAPAEFARLAGTLATDERRLAEKEEEWLALEIKRESGGG